ncbi:unnamed protein product [Rhizoctonia solani]|uniref:Uncharacterized protein n=1 Tax=Rhizoctonia solani TaxID=456999 RepID=A0A8H2XBR9_9AGAM|nr:unnamed protein product [Rhizoctonia solani]
MELFGSHGILTHPRRAEERKNFISSSFTSSADLSQRLTSSSNDDPSRSLAMRFHEEWLHPECPVNEWYQQQQQVRSSTQFKRIEHWRANHPPFYHEYLLIRLGGEDGDICRVERLGDGSRRNAVTRVGCTAYDIIQSFSASEYALHPMSKEPADLICQIDAPREFNLLDVLAICWSLQHTQRCSKYTLQRYNCYFLCLTVLAVLARRVGEWEAVVGNEATWLGLVNDAINYLQQTPCDDAEELAGVGVCDIVNPSHPDPRAFLLGPLRTRLTDNGFENWKTCISETLWVQDLEGEFKKGLASCVKDSVGTALGSNSDCATNMKAILDFNPDYEDECKAQDISQELVTAVMLQEFQIDTQLLSDAATSADRTRQMRELEYRRTLLRKMSSWARVPTLYARSVIRGPKLFIDQNRGGEPTMIDQSIAKWIRRHPLDAFIFMKLLCSNVKGELPTAIDFDSLDKQTASLKLKRLLTLPVLATQATKVQILMITLIRRKWIAGLQACVGTVISNKTKDRISKLASTSKSCVLRMTDSTGRARELTVPEFHNHIISRTRAHGKNVESKRLAAAELVELDIGIAMSEVWKGLPKSPGDRLKKVDWGKTSQVDRSQLDRIVPGFTF